MLCNFGFDRFMSSRSPNVGCYFRLILQIMMLIIEMDASHAHNRKNEQPNDQPACAGAHDECLNHPTEHMRAHHIETP